MITNIFEIKGDYIMGYLIQQSNTTRHIYFLMVDSSDHITGKTGLSPTVTICKNGGSFASPAGAVTEVANGWYRVAANATDANTLGPLLLHATGSGADPTDDRFEVVVFNPDNLLNQTADTLLTRDFNSVSGEASRSALNSLRKLMNKVAVSGTTLTVYKEDDATSAFTQTVTTSSSAEPIISVDTQ